MATCRTCGGRLRTKIQNPDSAPAADYCIVCQPREEPDGYGDRREARTARIEAQT